jgi:hypothetical protein
MFESSRVPRLRSLSRPEQEDDCDSCQGPKTAPANKLSEDEAQRLVEYANTEAPRDLSPNGTVLKVMACKTLDDSNLLESETGRVAESHELTG